MIKTQTAIIRRFLEYGPLSILLHAIRTHNSATACIIEDRSENLLVHNVDQWPNPKSIKEHMTLPDTKLVQGTWQNCKFSLPLPI